MRDDGPPGVREVVRGGGDPQRIEPGRQLDEHVVGVRHPQQVADHPAVAAAGGAEAVRGEHAVPRRDQALRGQPGAAALALAAGDRPRDDDPVADRDRADGVACRDDLGDALVADRERAGEGHGTADVGDGRVDHAGLQPGLQRAGDAAVDRERVAVAAADHDRPHDRVGRRLKDRVRPLDPLQAAGRDQVQLAHRGVSSSPRWPSPATRRACRAAWRSGPPGRCPPPRRGRTRRGRGARGRRR